MIDTSGKARQQFEAVIEKGRNEATTLFNRLHNEIPTDVIAPAPLLEAVVAESQVRLRNPKFEYSLHRNARSQLYTKLGFPAKYADDLLQLNDDETGTGSWATDLLEHNLNTLLQNDNSKYLIRSINGEARGFLSDRYRRLDGRPILEAILDETKNYYAVPISGIVSDLSFALKLALPTVYEALPGQPFVYWLEISTSNFGTRKVQVSNGLTVLVCLNGAKMDEIFGQRHIGKQMPDDIEMSQETMRLDTEWTVSAMRDVVRATMNPFNVERIYDRVKNANEKKLDSKNFVGLVKKLGLTKEETEKAETLYGLNDVEFLPPGDSYWKGSNVVSYIAVNTKDQDRRLELEEIAGFLLQGHAARREQAA